MTFDEADLGRAFGAGVSAGLRAASASAAVLRDRAAARALRLLRGVRRRTAAAQADELDRIADHLTSILRAVLDDLAPATVRLGAGAALRRLLREALAAGAGQGRLAVETTADVVAALRSALTEETDGASMAAVELRVDPDLPAGALRVRWSTGWTEAHAGAVTELLRERLAALMVRTPEGATA